MKITKKQEEFCISYFGRDSGFIKKLLEELEVKSMNDIVNTYQFNIGFNEGIRGAFKQMEQELESNLGSKPIQDFNEIEERNKGSQEL